ncbi:hypothetical protein B1812_11750 [Methylocystis bryophila]|uniref:Uncharacterized protein n=1 Tax=Methylocystis bryophila TaxID=655015 RepID=A0A1W6MVM7_9HYPH|nr:hypothetical protein B1812_11750 [Methylocystis bryophila]
MAGRESLEVQRAPLKGEGAAAVFIPRFRPLWRIYNGFGFSLKGEGDLQAAQCRYPERAGRALSAMRKSGARSFA